MGAVEGRVVHPIEEGGVEGAEGAVAAADAGAEERLVGGLLVGEEEPAASQIRRLRFESRPAPGQVEEARVGRHHDLLHLQVLVDRQRKAPHLRHQQVIPLRFSKAEA